MTTNRIHMENKMFIVFCIFYIITLLATGYVSWMIFRANYYKLRWLILVLFFIYHLAIYYFENSPMALIILSVVYGFMFFDIIYHLSKRVVDESNSNNY